MQELRVRGAKEKGKKECHFSRVITLADDVGACVLDPARLPCNSGGARSLIRCRTLLHFGHCAAGISILRTRESAALPRSTLSVYWLARCVPAHMHACSEEWAIGCLAWRSCSLRVALFDGKEHPWMTMLKLDVPLGSVGCEAA